MDWAKPGPPSLNIKYSRMYDCLEGYKGSFLYFPALVEPYLAKKEACKGWQKRWLCSAADQSQAEGGRYEATNGNR